MENDQQLKYDTLRLNFNQFHISARYDFPYVNAAPFSEYTNCILPPAYDLLTYVISFHSLLSSNIFAVDTIQSLFEFMLIIMPYPLI